MFFKLFILGSNTEKDILKKGFSINSYKECNVYNGLDLEFTAKLPKDYFFDGSIWVGIDVSPYADDDRLLCLARTPFLSFQELWTLALQAEREDDRIGALLLMYKRDYQQIRQKYKALVDLNDNTSIAEKRVLKKLSKIM